MHSCDLTPVILLVIVIIVLFSERALIGLRSWEEEWCCEEDIGGMGREEKVQQTLTPSVYFV